MKYMYPRIAVILDFDIGFYSVNFPDQFPGEYFLRRPVCSYIPLFNDAYFITIHAGMIEIMEHHNHRELQLTIQCLNKLQHIQLMSNIQIGCRIQAVWPQLALHPPLPMTGSHP